MSLPAIPRFNTSDKALAAWVAAVTEHLEVLSGVRGKAENAAVTKAELDEAISAIPTAKTVTKTETVAADGVSLTSEEFRTAVQEEARAVMDTEGSRASEAALLARIRQVEATAGSTNPLVALTIRKNTGPRHPGKPEFLPNVVFYNDITIAEYVLDAYQRTHTGEKPMVMHPQTMFYNGYTISAFALDIYRRTHTGETPMVTNPNTILYNGASVSQIMEYIYGELGFRSAEIAAERNRNNDQDVAQYNLWVRMNNAESAIFFAYQEPTNIYSNVNIYNSLVAAWTAINSITSRLTAAGIP